MADIEEEQQPRLSEYCPVCKHLMLNSENLGWVCQTADVLQDNECPVLDGAFCYNPKTGEEYEQIDFEILRALSIGDVDVQTHLRDAGIEADLIGMIKEHWGNEESRTRITRLFSAITWPPYDHLPEEGTHLA
jgi:hypothetical protein